MYACNSSTQEVDAGSTAVPLDLSSEFHSQTLKEGRERRIRGNGIEIDCLNGLDWTNKIPLGWCHRAKIPRAFDSLDFVLEQSLIMGGSCHECVIVTLFFWSK